jgi:protein SCO1/2
MRFSPSILILILALSCTKGTKELPILSYTINENGVAEEYRIKYEGFVDQDSVDFSSSNLQNKIVVSNFFFTRCPSICPPMRNQLIRLLNDINYADLVLISHTIDPDYDTPKILKSYSESTSIPKHKWWFLYAPKADMKHIAHQYMTNFRPNNDGSDFLHSSYAALLDEKQRIRGFYNLLVTEDVNRLEQDIKFLINEGSL